MTAELTPEDQVVQKINETDGDSDYEQGHVAALRWVLNLLQRHRADTTPPEASETPPEAPTAAPTEPPVSDPTPPTETPQD